MIGPRPIRSTLMWGWFWPSGALAQVARTRMGARLFAEGKTARCWALLAAEGHRTVRVVVDPIPAARQQPDHLSRTPPARTPSGSRG